MIRVLDVSKYQGQAIQWNLVAQIPDLRGVYFECQQGNDAANPYFAKQVAGARGVGLATGIYHFAEPLPEDGVHANRDPDGQIALAWAAAGGQPCVHGDMPPMLDMETPTPDKRSEFPGCTSASIAQWTAAALSIMDDRWERSAGIYTYGPWWQALEGAGLDQSFADRALWFAKYPGAWDSKPPPDGTPMPTVAPWSTSTLWQHGCKIPLPGGGLCDGSVFAGDENAWRAFLGY